MTLVSYRFLPLVWAVVGSSTLGVAQRAEVPKGKRPARPPLYEVGGKYGGRSVGRARLAPEVAEAIEAGLAWLERHQEADGGFDAVRFRNLDRTGKKVDGAGEGLGRVGITGICMLPFLGDGSTVRSGPHQEVLEKATKWLVEQQQKGGVFSSNLLEHTLASYALAEAYGLSQIPEEAGPLKAALNHLLSVQNKDGGWSYEGQGKPSDAVTTCHAVLAYRTALDFRLVADRKPLERAGRWLDEAMKPDGTVAKGLAVPVSAGMHQERTGTAAVLLGRVFLRRSPRKNPEMMKGADRIIESLGSKPDPNGNPKAKAAARINAALRSSTRDQVFEFLAAISLYQIGGRAWRGWEGIMTAIPKAQRRRGNFKGSWDPRGAGTVRGGRLYATALSVLTLEVYYRYSRLIR